MAARKEPISQNDFSAGSPRPEAVERDDSPLITEGSAEAINLIGLTTGATERRPGTVQVNTTNSKFGKEMDLGRGRVYDLHIVPDGLVLYDSTGAVEVSFLSSTWTSILNKFGSRSFDEIQFWAFPDPDSSAILIGAQDFPPHGLTVDSAGTWSFGELVYATAPAGLVNQPYWNYYPGVSVDVSSVTGAVTVTASAAIWTTSHVGLRIRVGGREVVLTSYSSSTVMNGTVTTELAPRINVAVASISGFQIGDAVEHSTLGGQGIIVAFSGTTVLIQATAIWNGWAGSGNLVGPNASQTISSYTAFDPYPTFDWDIQMGQTIHGYPGWGARHKGRTYLCGYPGAPQAFAVSAAGTTDDFTLGVDDGDGFVETIGSNDGGDLIYIISTEDLLFFTTKGIYYQQTRNQEDITPTTIGPVSFSKTGCARVLPVAVDDGAVFVDAVGEQIYAAVLSGDVYKNWRRQPLSEFHSHLITGPLFIGATSSGSEKPENFLYVVNSDGTVATGQWNREAQKLGWRPWVTEGSFKAIYQVFGKSYGVVERTINGVVTTFRERFETGIYMDCVASLLVNDANPTGLAGQDYFAGVTAAATHLDGHTATGYFEGWDLGDRTVNAAGALVDDAAVAVAIPDYDGILQIGLKFEIDFVPWARRSVETFRGARDVKRTTKMMFTVQDTLAFKFEGQTWGGYVTGDDLTIPPPFRSEEATFITGGREAFEARHLIVDRPGPFRMLKQKYKVTV